MPEAPQGGPERMMGAAPEWIGAVFKQGNRRNQVMDYSTGEILVPVFDVTERKEREQWIFENMRVFLDGTVASPEGKWKPIIDNWLSELRFAANKARLDRKELHETEDDLKALMAVCSSARAMEVSSGTASTYLTYITLSEGGRNLDVQDTWSDFILHKDPDKLKRVVGFLRDKEKGPLSPRLPARFPLIQFYYNLLVDEAGIRLVDADPSLIDNENIEVEIRKGLIREDRIGIESIDTKRALGSNLVKFLKGEGGRRGLNDYVSDFMDDEKDPFKAQWGSDSERWTAAKIATDAFLVNLYTRWEYEIHKEGVDERGKEVMYKPVPTWGGDPFRAILEPSFLPRRIKHVYDKDKGYKEDALILDLVDAAFRPEDLADNPDISSEQREGVKEGLLLPSAVTHLKTYARYNNALWSFFGENSRVIGIPQWTKDTMGKELPAVAENLDQVYGGMKIERRFPNLGKHVMGVVMMRLIHCKALAVAMETSRPSFAGKIGILFGDEKTRPFLEVRQFLYGPLMDARDGFFEDLTGARTRFVFDKNNIFYKDISARWKETWEILASSDQTPEGRKSAKALNKLGFIVDSLTAISQTRKRG